MKNFIIGHGDSLTKSVTIKGGGGDKSHPYSIEEGRSRLLKDLSELLPVISSKPENQCANDEVVVKFIQHPSYLSKTYYPKSFFKKFGMKDIGSRSINVKPLKWAVKRHPVEGVASCIYVSGKKSSFNEMYDYVQSARSDDSTLDIVRTFESVNDFDPKEKLKWIDNEQELLTLEVVLHSPSTDLSIVNLFERFTTAYGINVQKSKAKVVGGLTFIPVNAPKGAEMKIAEFSHVRALRSMPKLRIFEPNAIRQNISTEFKIPEENAVSQDIKVCIIDGGLGDHHLLGSWAKEIIPNDVIATHPALLSHGGEVCSAYLFGTLDGNESKLSRPYTNVDVVRVLSPDDKDPDLFDVLTRIENVIKEGNYKYINLSLGPRIAIDDDDVHVWTSVLDSLLQDGSCLATVAIGNDGELGGELNRIQPPSDMVNCFSIGAHDSNGDEWTRAPYSCVGPGRSPGIVKPDAVAFGGTESNLLKVYSPQTHQIIGTMGTSYAAPLALRVAAGIDAITDMDLSPATVKALMIHNAMKENQLIKDVGWGKLPSTPEEVIECLEDEAVIVYQGSLTHSQHLRVPIPLPESLNCTWVHLKATFCINTVTDPEHPLHYTRGGLDISFRPNGSKKAPEAEHASTDSFFTNKLFMTEQECRDDAHKWETCISRERRFKNSTLNKPVFDVKYHSREQGAATPGSVAPLSYSLVVSIRAQGDSNLYNSVLQQYRTLQPVRMRNTIQIT